MPCINKKTSISPLEIECKHEMKVHISPSTLFFKIKRFYCSKLYYQKKLIGKEIIEVMYSFVLSHFVFKYVIIYCM